VKTDKFVKTGWLTLCVALVCILGVPRLARTQNAGHGKELFERRCSGCHALDSEKEGPRLRGFYGRASGSVASFKYSDALKAAHITWDAASIDRWLADPEKFIPDNDMAFQLANAQERIEIIAYLKQLSAR